MLYALYNEVLIILSADCYYSAMRRTVATQFFLQASQLDGENCCKEYEMKTVMTEWVQVQMYLSKHIITVWLANLYKK